MPDNYIQWPQNANPDDVFTSDYGKTWIFDGCGWVSTCCPPVVLCDPEVNGISVIYFQKKAGLISGYGVSHFTWNGNFNRYEGFINVPMIIRWTGSQWRLIRSSDDAVLATSPTTNILEAVWNNISTWDEGDLGLVQIECGLIYNQLCVDVSYLVTLPDGTPTIGPFTLHPNNYASIQDIIDGVQPDSYIAMDSNGYNLYLEYDSFDLVWYMGTYGGSWTINAAPNQNALILGSDWLSDNEEVNATFIQGACTSECYPERDGITLMYNYGDNWTPIYLPWDPVSGYYFSDNQYINQLFGWNSVSVQYDAGNNQLKIVKDSGSGPASIGGNQWNGGWEILFNHNWGESFDVYCGDVGCSRMCATLGSNSTTIVPYGYNTIESLIDCKSNFKGWIGWNGTNEVIYLDWNDGANEYKIDIDGNGLQLIPVTSHTSAALIAGSPYNYDQNGVTGTLTLTSGDCP